MFETPITLFFWIPRKPEKIWKTLENKERKEKKKESVFWETENWTLSALSVVTSKNTAKQNILFDRSLLTYSLAIQRSSWYLIKVKYLAGGPAGCCGSLYTEQPAGSLAGRTTRHKRLRRLIETSEFRLGRTFFCLKHKDNKLMSPTMKSIYQIMGLFKTGSIKTGLLKCREDCWCSTSVCTCPTPKPAQYSSYSSHYLINGNSQIPNQNCTVKPLPCKEQTNLSFASVQWVSFCFHIPIPDVWSYKVGSLSCSGQQLFSDEMFPNSLIAKKSQLGYVIR